MMLKLSLDTRNAFKRKTGLPLVSSPVPFRRSGNCPAMVNLDEGLDSVKAIKKAFLEKDVKRHKREECENLSSPLDRIRSRDDSPLPTNKRRSSTRPSFSMTPGNLLGNFEESMLNGRLKAVNKVEGFTVEIGASGSFCPSHQKLPAAAHFYTIEDSHRLTIPYMTHAHLGRKGYRVPRKGTVQFTLFNPHETVVKMFVIQYDFSDMPPNSHTFLRQRTLYMPTDASENDPEYRKWLRYLIHLRFATSKSGRLYIHSNVRMIISRKSDFEPVDVTGERKFDWREFTAGPTQPRYSSRSSI